MDLDFIKEVSDYNINAYIIDNHAIHGNNGPYKDEDNPVRNTAHWLITYAYLYKKYKSEEYREIVKKFAEYLVLDSHYGNGGCIKIRNNKLNDYTNGLIGQAWVIEALIYATKCLEDEKYYNKAMSIFQAHPFDENMKLWRIRDIDGTTDKIDFVYNHQLWFAGVGAMLSNYKYNEKIEKEIRSFMNNYKNNLAIQPSGLLFHQTIFKYDIISKLKLKLKCIFCDLAVNKKWRNQRELEEGYETFDFYGFAIIHTYMPELSIFKDKKFTKALNYCLSKKRINKLCVNNYINKYSYPYNSPAFEYPFIEYVFLKKIDTNLLDMLCKTQKNRTYDENKKLFLYNTEDKYTLTARIYELVRYYELLDKGGTNEPKN